MIQHTEVRSGVEVQMTLPYERTRSVVQAQEFLVELSRDTTLSESIRNEARRLLCH
ncbi:TPA: BPSL0761 family protein, partial [Pseudomonas aeruginosa]